MDDETKAPERIWHSIDRRGKISGSPDAHVKPTEAVADAYREYVRLEAVRANPTEFGVEVKVKKLEWVRLDNGRLRAEFVKGMSTDYYIYWSQGSFIAHGLIGKSTSFHSHGHADEDSAKASAQDHHETLVKECLE